jgi:hypothetical protein
MAIFLQREGNFYNPFFLQDNKGKSYEIIDIIFYNRKGIVHSVGRGWFGANNNIDMLRLNQFDKVKFRRKENFKRNEAFYIYDKSKYYSRNVVKLYLPIHQFTTKLTKNDYYKEYPLHIEYYDTLTILLNAEHTVKERIFNHKVPRRDNIMLVKKLTQYLKKLGLEADPHIILRREEAYRKHLKNGNIRKLAEISNVIKDLGIRVSD